MFLNKRIEDFGENGCSIEAAIYLDIENLKKSDLSFKQLEFVYGKLYWEDDTLKSHFLEKAKSKAEDFEQWLWVWDRISNKSTEKPEIWEILKQKAVIPRDLEYLWGKSKDRDEKAEILKNIAGCIGNFDQLKDVLKDFYNKPEQCDIFKAAKSNVKTFKQCFDLLEYFHMSFDYGSDVQEAILERALDKATKLSDCLYILQKSRGDLPWIVDVFKKALDETNTLEERLVVYRHINKNISKVSGVLELLRAKAETFEEYVALHKLSKYSNVMKSEAFEKAKSKAEDFEQWLWVWRSVAKSRKAELGLIRGLFWGFTSEASTEKAEIWRNLKQKASTSDQSIWIWENSEDGFEKAEVWKILKQEAVKVEQLNNLFEKTFFDSKERAEILELLKRKTKALVVK